LSRATVELVTRWAIPIASWIIGLLGLIAIAAAFDVFERQWYPAAVVSIGVITILTIALDAIAQGYRR